jgi:hypothetical protein
VPALVCTLYAFADHEEESLKRAGKQERKIPVEATA